MVFESVLIANRGEIAVRVIRACRELGIRTVAVHSDSDADSLHVRMADEAVSLGGSTALDSYLRVDKILDAMDSSGAQAIHPGYGFLSENVALSRAVTEAGKAFIGPGPDAVDSMGSKVAAREIAIAAGVPVVPGTTRPATGPDDVRAFAELHGFPVAIKASHGGGGRGMRVVSAADEIEQAWDSARNEARSAFGNDEVYLEKFLEHPRHIEIQLIADSHGNVVWLGDRDCSVQRRHQKLIEEAPAVLLSGELRVRMGEAAAALARQVGYVNAGTVEFLVQDGDFWFLEMNTRLQVEHPVTEMTTGLDIVIEQIRVAAGQELSVSQSDIVTSGHAIEMRINAEDPAAGRFLPTPGRLDVVEAPPRASVRFDTGYESGDEVGAQFDSLIGKLIAWAPTRELAIENARYALSRLTVDGTTTTAPAHALILDHDDFRSNTHTTRWLEQSVTFPEEFSTDWRSQISDPREDVSIAGRVARIPRALRRNGDVEAGAFGGPSRATESSRPEPAGSSDGSLRSPMQGTVVAVSKAVGDSVAPNEVICVIEAMKMANELRSPGGGVLTDLSVAVGSLVAAGDLIGMVELEEMSA